MGLGSAFSLYPGGERVDRLVDVGKWKVQTGTSHFQTSDEEERGSREEATRKEGI